MRSGCRHRYNDFYASPLGSAERDSSPESPKLTGTVGRRQITFRCGPRLRILPVLDFTFGGPFRSRKRARIGFWGPNLPRAPSRPARTREIHTGRRPPCPSRRPAPCPFRTACLRTVALTGLNRIRGRSRAAYLRGKSGAMIVAMNSGRSVPCRLERAGLLARHAHAFGQRASLEGLGPID